jgi:hypothetical protein
MAPEIEKTFSVFGRERKLESLKGVWTPSDEILFIHCLGFRSFSDYSGFINLIDGLEIKPEKFYGDDQLFTWKGKCLRDHSHNFSQLINRSADLGLQLQFHLPYRKIEGKTLYASNPEDHDSLIQVIETYADVIARFGLNQARGKVNLTMHPPEIADIDDQSALELALLRTNEFYLRLGERIESENWPVVIGIENMPDPKINNYAIDAIGYAPDHFTKMLKGTNDSIQLTVDSGHRMISSELTVSELVQWCLDHDKYMTNFHFHVNNGIDEERTVAGESCDLHNLAVPSGLHGFTMYLLRAVTENVPLNLEIKAKHYSPEELFFYVSGLRCSIDHIYGQVKNDVKLISSQQKTNFEFFL